MEVQEPIGFKNSNKVSIAMIQVNNNLKKKYDVLNLQRIICGKRIMMMNILCDTKGNV